MKASKILHSGRFFIVTLLLFQLIWLFAAPVQAKKTILTGTCGQNATWKYDSSKKTFTISGKGEAILNREETGYLEADISPRKLVVKEGITSIVCYNKYRHDFDFEEFKLTSVSLPKSLKSIRGPLFMNCSISSLTIPKKVKQLDAIPFLAADIKKLKVDEKNPYFVIDKNGVLFTKNKKKLVYYPVRRKAKTYHVPKSVTQIGEMAFCMNLSLRKVVLTKNIKKIGNGAFSYCNFLKNINMQVTKVKQIQDYCGKTYGLQKFFGYYGDDYEWGEVYEDYPDTYDLALYHVVSGDSYRNADGRLEYSNDNPYYFGTFQGTALESFEMPDSLKYAGKQTFYPGSAHQFSVSWIEGNISPSNGLYLKKLVIGKNFQGEINGGKSNDNNRKTTLDLHFDGTAKVKGKWTDGFLMESVKVHKKNKKYKVKDGVLYSKNMDTIYLTTNKISKNFVVGTKVHYLARGAFYANGTLKSVEFKGDIPRITDFAFQSCGNLESVKMTKPVDSIGHSAFGYCYKLSLGADSIRYIDKGGFCYTKQISFDSSNLTSIGEMAFFGCKTESVNIHAPLKMIGKYAFAMSNTDNINVHSTESLVVDDFAFYKARELVTASITSDKTLTLGQEIFRYSSVERIELSKGTVIPEGGLCDTKHYYFEPKDVTVIWK